MIVRRRVAAVALGAFCAASAAADPLDLARELADRLAAGAGALMPAADRVQVEEERIVPLDASWPADFLAGLVAEKRFGHEVFPVYARLDNATGAAVFYDVDGLAFHEIEPLVPPIDATTWLESLLGPATSPGDAWRELSHVVARFLLVPADDLEGYLADAAEDAALCARSAPRQRTSPPAVTKLTLTDISFTPTSVLVNAEWPAGSLPGNAFDLYLSQTLRKTGWQPYMAFAAPGQTNVTSFCTEIPNEDIPGWTDPATLHDASCPVATNNRFPASTRSLEPDADAATTNAFVALNDELVEIAVDLETPGKKRHETLVGLPEEDRPFFVRSLYVSFLTKGPESPFGFGKIPDSPESIVQNRRKWGRIHSDEQVAAGRLRNRMARAAFISFLQSTAASLQDPAQQGVFLASCSVWVDFEAMRGDLNQPVRRRAEDGIPSDEALLRWFADNENFCDEVRAAASNRLERIVPRMPDTAIPPPENPTNGVSSVAAPVAEPRKTL